MNRILLVFSALVLSFVHAGTQEWQQFGIEKFGFVFEVPPEFELLHRSEDGDGAAFQSPDTSRTAPRSASRPACDFDRMIPGATIACASAAGSSSRSIPSGE